jgi:hypothetical protein
MASAQYCSPGAATTCDNVLIVCTFSGNCADVRSKLQSTAAFATVDVFRADSGTPSASLLARYHAVFVFSSDPIRDPILLGDRIAAYHDQGGGVVVALWANNNNAASLRLQGAYGTVASGYALLDYPNGGAVSPSDSLGDVLEPDSPLLYGVASLFALSAFRSTAPLVVGRGVVVARWRGGGQEPLVLRGTRGGRTLVELNFYPVSSSAGYYSFWTGDGAQLLRNGLKFSRCMPCGAGTYAAAGDVTLSLIRRGRGRELVCAVT